MRKIKINVSEDGSIKIAGKLNGINGESNASEIAFTVPEKYKEYNKFLDIITPDGEISQIALSLDGENEFGWVIPGKLSSGNGFDAQLVMKKGGEIFKSVLFAVTFEWGINATEYMESEYTDSIELLFETKADKEEISALDKKINTKLASEIYHSEKEEFLSMLEKKAEKEELPGKLSQLENDINAVTDESYVHTDNNYSDLDKAKINDLAKDIVNCGNDILELKIKSGEHDGEIPKKLNRKWQKIAEETTEKSDVKAVACAVGYDWGGIMGIRDLLIRLYVPKSDDKTSRGIQVVMFKDELTTELLDDFLNSSVNGALFVAQSANFGTAVPEHNTVYVFESKFLADGSLAETTMSHSAYGTVAYPQRPWIAVAKSNLSGVASINGKNGIAVKYNNGSSFPEGTVLQVFGR